MLQNIQDLLNAGLAMFFVALQVMLHVFYTVAVGGPTNFIFTLKTGHVLVHVAIRWRHNGGGPPTPWIPQNP